MSMAGLIFNLTKTPPGYAAVGTWGSAFCELPAAQMIGWDIHLLAYWPISAVPFAAVQAIWACINGSIYCRSAQLLGLWQSSGAGCIYCKPANTWVCHLHSIP